MTIPEEISELIAKTNPRLYLEKREKFVQKVIVTVQSLKRHKFDLKMNNLRRSELREEEDIFQ